MMKAEVIGTLTADARVGVMDGRDAVLFEVAHIYHGKESRVECALPASRWGLGLMPSLRAGCWVMVAGHYSDRLEGGRIRRCIRSFNFHLFNAKRCLAKGNGHEEGQVCD